MQNVRLLATLCIFAVLLALPQSARSESFVYEEYQETVAAKVISIIGTEERELPGLDTTVSIQEVSVQLLSGSKKDETVAFSNELAAVSVGDRIFIDRRVTMEGREYYVLKDVDRRLGLTVLALLFVGLIVWFSRSNGLRALVCLAISVAAIIFILVPVLLAGYNPALSSLVISGGILTVVLFGTHGINAFSTIAALGTLCAISVTCAIAYVFVDVLRFTGFGSHEAVYLNFSTGGSLDFAGLLLGSIIIGMLGVLDDVAITQASVVAELKRANPSLDAHELYRRATRVGRDHVASLVNTLALAYVGVSLPLILLLARAEVDIMMTINQELVAAELARIMIGSIGIVLTVPATTAIGAWYFGKKDMTHQPDTHHHHHH